MSEYLQNATLEGVKIKDIYRIKAIYNEETKEWLRNQDGSLDGTDIYIECASGDMIYDISPSKRVIQAYIGSIGRGNNILKSIYSDLLGGKLKKFESIVKSKEGVERQVFDTDKLIKEINNIENCIIFNVVQNDSETQFDFNIKDIKAIAKLMKAKKPMANTSAFNSKYLPSHKEKLAAKKLEEARFVKYEMPKDYYKEISPLLLKICKNKSMKIDDTLTYCYREFGKKIKVKIIPEADKNNYKPMHYIHHLGRWGEFVDLISTLANECCS